MPQTIQHIYGKRPRRRYRPAEGAVMTQEEMWAFFAAYEGLDRTEGIVSSTGGGFSACARLPGA